MKNMKIVIVMVAIATVLGQSDISSFANIDAMRQTDIEAKFYVDFDLGQ
jgi:hypothetical protein